MLNNLNVTLVVKVNDNNSLGFFRCQWHRFLTVLNFKNKLEIISDFLL